MFPNKAQVDKHISSIVSKLKDTKEKHSRGYQFAKLYYDVRDYASAMRWLEMFFRVNDHYAPGHELKGKILEAQGEKQSALESYKRGYELDKTLSTLLIKICELSFEVEGGSEGARFWVEKLETVYPNHKMLFRMKEKIYQSSPKKNPDDLGKLLQIELMENPTDANLRVKYVSYLSEHTQKGREFAIRYCLESEQSVPHPNSPHWYRCLLNILESKDGKESVNTERIRLHAMNSVLRICVPSGGASLHDCQSLLCRFDALLGRTKLYDSSFIDEMEGWLHLYSALIATKLVEKGSSMSTDDPGLVYLAYMAFMDVGMSEGYGADVITSGDGQQLSGPLLHHLRSLGCRRRAEAGHLLVSLLGERALLDCVVQYDAHRPEGKVSLRKLVTELHGKAASSASLETSALMIAEVGTELTSIDWDDLIDIDMACALSCVADGHVIVWLLADLERNDWSGTRSQPHAVRPWDALTDTVLSLTLEVVDRCFPGLPMHPAFGPGASTDQQHSPETLSRMDVMVFLLLSAASLARGQDSLRPLSRCAPSEILPSPDQRRWWNAVMESCAPGTLGSGSVGQRRLALQRGIDSLRLRSRPDLLPGVVASVNILVSLLRLATLQVGLLDGASDALGDWADHFARHVLDRISALRRSREAGRTPLSTPKRAPAAAPFFPVWPANGDGALDSTELTELEFSAFVARAQVAELVDDWERAQAWWQRAVRLAEEANVGPTRGPRALDGRSAQHRLAKTFIRLFEDSEEHEEGRQSLLERARQILTKLKDSPASRGSGSESKDEVQRDLDLVLACLSDLTAAPSHADLDPVIAGQLNMHSSESAAARLSGVDANGSRSTSILRTPLRPSSTPDITRRSPGRDNRLESQLRTLTSALERVLNQQPENNRQLVETNVRLTNQLLETNRQLSETQSRLRETRRLNAQLKAKVQELQLALMQASSRPYATPSGWSQQWMTPQAAHVLAHIQQQQQQQQFQQLQQQQQQHRSSVTALQPSMEQFAEEEYGEEFYVYDDEDDEVEVEVFNRQGVTDANLKLVQQQQQRSTGADCSLPSPGFFNASSPGTKANTSGSLQRVTTVPNTIVTPPSLANFQKSLASTKASPSTVLSPSVPAKPNPSQAFGSFTSPTSPQVPQQAGQGIVQKPQPFVRASDQTGTGGAAAIPTLSAAAKPITSVSTTDASLAKPQATTTAAKPIFGFNPVALPQASATGTGIVFGKPAVSAQQPTASKTSPLFGGAAASSLQQPAAGKPSPLFGGTGASLPQQPAASKAGSLFSGTSVSTPQQPAVSKAGPLFGGASTSLPQQSAGSKTGPLFAGIATSTAQQSAVGKTLFGGASVTSPQPTATGKTGPLFGGAAITSPPQPVSGKTGTLFGGTTVTSPPQPVAGKTAILFEGTAVSSQSKSVPPLKLTGSPKSSFGSMFAPPAATTVNKGPTSPVKSPEDFEPDVHFEPAVESLPDLVEATTGEEDEVKLFEERARLFRFHKPSGEWKTRGTGEIRILGDEVGNRFRIVMRRDQVKKLCANHAIAPEMRLQPFASAPHAVMWAARDFADGGPEGCDETLAVRFKDEEKVTAFQKVFTECQAKIRAHRAKGGSTKDKTTPKAAPADTTTPTVSLLERFKLKPTEWTCDACYVTNTDADKACVACQTPRPGPKKPAAAETKTAVQEDPATTALRQRFQPKAGQWTCDTCLVVNNADVTACVSCTTPKPGTKPSVPFSGFSIGPTSTSSTIRFGAPPSTNTSNSGASSKSSILFGAPPSTASNTGTPSSSSGASGKSSILFGAPPSTASNTGTPSSSSGNDTIRFGAPTATTPSTGASPSTAGPAAIRFGAPPSTGATRPFFFGSAPPAATATPPQGSTAFDAPSSEAASSSRTFLFGDDSKGSSSATPTTQAASNVPSTQSSFVFGAQSGSQGSATAWPQFSALSTPKDAAASEAAAKAGAEKSPPSSNLWSAKNTSGSPGATGLSFTSPSNRKDSRSEDEEPEDEGDHLYFKPVLEKLPEKVEVATGEEGESALFERRAKLFRWAKEDGGSGGWKERGIGMMRILQHPSTRKARLVMRRDAVLKVCCNHQLHPGLHLKPMVGAAAAKSWTWYAVDFSEGTEANELFAVRFKDDADATEFARVFDEAKTGGGTGESPARIAPSGARGTVVTASGERKEAAESDEEVVFVRQEPAVTPEQASRAQKLQLPTHFYAYENAAAGPEVDSEEEDKIFAAFHARLAASKLSSAADPASKPAASAPAPAPAPAPASAPAPAPALSVSKTSSATPAFGSAADSTSGTKSLFANLPSLTASDPLSGRQPVFGAGSALPNFKSLASGAGEAGGSSSSFVLGSGASLPTFKSLAATSGPSSEAAPKGGDSSFKWAGAGTPLFGEGAAEGSKESAEEEEDGPNFEPIIPLPELVQVRTGEEDEEVLFKQRCRLYRFTDGQWKERGIGDMKILKRSNKRCRLVMRREQVHKLCCNQTISERIPDLMPMASSNNGLCWFAKDYSTPEGEDGQFAIRFKTPKELEEFRTCVASCKELLLGSQATAGSPAAGSSEVNVQPKEAAPAADGDDDEDERAVEQEEVWFSAFVTLTAADAASPAAKTSLRGNLRLVLDDDVSGGRIRFASSGAEARVLCNHIVTMETALAEDRPNLSALWSALDFSQDEARRRQYVAVFADAAELDRFKAAFAKAQSQAVESELMERQDCEEVEVPERVG